MKHQINFKSLPVVLSVLILLGILSVLSAQAPFITKCETAEDLQEYLRWTPDRGPLISAHRGGPMPGWPENAIETFEHSLTFAPCLIECDVRMTKDSVLVLMHDKTVDRTTTGEGSISELTLSQLDEMLLLDNDGNVTKYKTPTLEQVLSWAKGHAVLTLDVKGVELFEPVIKMVEELDAEGCSVIITYNTEAAKKVHKLNPALMISVSVRNLDDYQRMKDTGIPYKNWVAFVGVYEPEKELYDLLHSDGVRTILGTMGNLDRQAETKGLKTYQDLYKNGADILATDNVRLASEAIKSR